MTAFNRLGFKAEVHDDGVLAIHASHGASLSQDSAKEFLGWLMDEYGLTAADYAEADKANNEAYEAGAQGAFTKSVKASLNDMTRDAGVDGSYEKTDETSFDLNEVHVGTPIKRRGPGRPRKTS